jgi:hypothetical protein
MPRTKLILGPHTYKFATILLFVVFTEADLNFVVVGLGTWLSCSIRWFRFLTGWV